MCALERGLLWARGGGSLSWGLEGLGAGGYLKRVKLYSGCLNMREWVSFYSPRVVRQIQAPNLNILGACPTLLAEGQYPNECCDSPALRMGGSLSCLPRRLAGAGWCGRGRIKSRGL